MIQPYYPFSLIYMTDNTKTSKSLVDTGISQTDIDDDEFEYDEPSDQDMMSAFGTKWHDGL